MMKRRNRWPDLLLNLASGDHWERAGFHTSNTYPLKIRSYYAGLIQEASPKDPIARQSVPMDLEDENTSGDADPLGETLHMPVPGLIHVYRNRVLLLVTDRCFVNCRHCNRRWKRKDRHNDRNENVERWIEYLQTHPDVDDVLITGGDPLTLSDIRLLHLVKAIRGVSTAGVIRIGTRTPVVHPQRVSGNLCDALKKYHPIYLHTQFNHPTECTTDAARALNRLADAGINMGNQMVLLAGVNDNWETIAEVNRWLVRHRCRPYYLFFPENVRGTAHFHVSPERAAQIEDELRRNLSGIAMPQLVIDLPDGGGKIPVRELLTYSLT